MTEQLAFLAGKIILGGYFILKGLKNIYNPSDAEILRPGLTNYITSAAVIAGGASLVTGIYPRPAIILLLAYLLAANVSVHDFWNKKEERERAMEAFMRNAALMGALLMLLRADWTIYGLGLSALPL